VSIDELCSFNDLPRTARLKKGQVLVVPSPLPGSKAAPPPVRTAASAAAKRDGEIRALPTPEAAVTRPEEVPPFRAAAGPTGSSVPALPARVDIPASGFETMTASRPDPAAETVRYTVRSGDTLTRIATRFRITVDELASLNRIRISGTLRVGQSLFVPRGSSE
jgi:LysM repeat protein